jgi:hypothetical protein
MKATRKKNQHYVFQAYLKPWSDDEQIWCLRRGEIFRSNLRNVACERFFYRSYPLTTEEREFVDKVMIDDAPEHLKIILQKFMKMYCIGHQIKAIEKKRASWSSEREALLDTFIETGSEDWHTKVEEGFLPFLNQMREGKIDFYQDWKLATMFLFGLCAQFTRTKQSREAALRVMGDEVKGRRTVNMMSVLASLVAIRLSYGLLLERKSFKVEIVENESNTPFITTDQPVINMRGDMKAVGVPPDEFELFYPVSPKRAMAFLKKETTVPLTISAIAADAYNVMAAQHSHEQIFCNSQEYLETFSKVIGGVGSGNRLCSW